jgi:predicted membrane-bound spermidine synthase
VFLAIGYWIGGYISATASHLSVEYGFLATPIASAFAIVLSAILYPIVFPYLSQINLVAGSFIGATLILALPLIALSAMNPLLIGLQRDQMKVGDAGAGRVFFISTMGSVAGVLITAFLFIPNVTNFRALMVIGFAVSVISIILVAVSRNLIPKQKRLLMSAGLAVTILCSAIFFEKQNYLKLVSSFFENPLTYEIQAEYTSIFGNIKVAEVAPRDGSGIIEKYFIQDGLVQNRTNKLNKSISMYTYVLESLVHAYAPKSQNVIVFGLGAGIVPKHFKADGKNVAVVEINSAALKAATDNFGFDETGIQIFLEDARTFVRKCERTYDAAVVDLFFGDNIPDYLMTKEFFGDLRKCLRPNGVMVMNTVFDNRDDEPNKRLLATIATSFPKLYLSGIRGGNIFIVGTSGVAPEKILVEAKGLPQQLSAMVKFSLSRSRQVPFSFFKDSKPVSDDQNIFSVLFANANMVERKILAGRLPPHMLVN